MTRTTIIKKMTRIAGITLLFILPKLACASLIRPVVANQVVYEGQTFVVDWQLDTKDQPINTLDLEWDFAPENLDLLSAEPGNSIVSLWIKKPTLSAPGVITLLGGIPSGASGENLPVARMVFLAKKTGQVNVNLNPKSQILLSDGQGNKDNLEFQALQIPIVPKNFSQVVISSKSQPDQTIWYQTRNVSILVKADSSKRYSYSFSSNPEIIPPTTVMDVSGELNFNNLPDGTYYFKVAEKLGESWQEAGVFRVQIDASPPEDFKPIINSDPQIFNGSQTLNFNTVDKTSGISGYLVKTSLFGKFLPAESPYQIKKSWVGNSITVRALDKAGNTREIKVTFKGYLSQGQFSVLLAILLALLILLLYRGSKILVNKRNKSEV